MNIKEEELLSVRSSGRMEETLTGVDVVLLVDLHWLFYSFQGLFCFIFWELVRWVTSATCSLSPNPPLRVSDF